MGSERTCLPLRRFGLTQTGPVSRPALRLTDARLRRQPHDSSAASACTAAPSQRQPPFLPCPSARRAVAVPAGARRPPRVPAARLCCGCPFSPAVPPCTPPPTLHPFPLSSRSPPGSRGAIPVEGTAGPLLFCNRTLTAAPQSGEAVSGRDEPWSPLSVSLWGRRLRRAVEPRPSTPPHTGRRELRRGPEPTHPGPQCQGAWTNSCEQAALMPGPQGAPGAPAMSLGKLSPVSWVSGSQGKRRLTADMISPPLGDFRHTMHVGRGGDVFGDTSFLSNHGGSSGATHRSPRSFLARKLQQVRRVGAPPRRMASPPAPSPAPPAISPIIKNAISLPQLNQAAYDSLVVGKLSFDSSLDGCADGRSSYGLDSGFCTISRLPRQEKPRDRDRDSSFPSEPQLRRSDSLLSFRLDLDLGPSLLTELLGVMSLSEASAAESPTPAPATNTPASAANTPTLASNPPARGHFPNGVSSGLGPAAEAKARPVGESPRAPADRVPPTRHWGAGWGGSQGSRHYNEMDARQELVRVLPQARASWESLDEEWGAPQTGTRAPVPSTVQANTFAFADAEEEDDEVKV